MAKKTKKNRKYGRNKTACAQYASEGRREKNKARTARREKRKEEKKHG